MAIQLMAHGLHAAHQLILYGQQVDPSIPQYILMLSFSIKKSNKSHKKSL
jgi:hypothetical protein